MKMRTSTIAVAISLLFSNSLLSTDLIELDSILGKQELCISDGSSIYIFSPDKNFRLEPIGTSGRTITGTWSSGSGGLHIEGKWSWINGLSADDDFRELDIYIGSLRNKSRVHTSMDSATKHTIYECYFLIERLEKKK